MKTFVEDTVKESVDFQNYQEEGLDLVEERQDQFDRDLEGEPDQFDRD